MYISDSWRSALRNSGTVLASNAASQLLVFAATALIARRLGPEDFGWYSFVLVYVGFVAILPELGMDSILIRNMARDDQQSAEILSNAITLRLLSVVVSIITGVLVFQFLGTPSSLTMVMAVAMPYVASFSLGAFAETRFRARMAMMIPAAGKVASKILLFLFVVLGLRLVSGELVLLAAVALTVLPDILSTSFVFLSSARQVKLGLVISWRAWVSILSESWPLALMAILVMVYLRIDVLMLSLMSTPEAVGNYAAAFKLVEVWGGIAMALGVSLLPMLSRSAAGQSNLDFWKTYQQSFGGLMLLLVPVSFFISLYSRDIVTLIYGAQYQQSALALRLLIWGQVFASAGVLYTTALTASGRQRLNLVLSLASALVNVLINLILIPAFGISGAAIATLLAYGTGTILLLLLRETRHYITPLFKAAVVPILASLMFVLVALGIRGNLVNGLLVSGAVYLIFTIALTKLFGARLSSFGSTPS